MNGVLLIGEGMGARFRVLLEDFGYKVSELKRATSIDDIAAAIVKFEKHVDGRVGAMAVGASATLLLEAATVVPKLAAIVLFGASLPAPSVHLDRIHTPIQIHRADHGKGMTAADLRRLRRDVPAQVMMQDWDYPTANDRFAVEPSADEADDATIAWDRTRDFLTNALE